MSTPADTNPPATSGTVLVHPELGILPARQVLDCIFALHPQGSILHRHITEMRTEQDTSGTRFVLESLAPDPAHARCRIIPPRVAEFR
ncbi:MAG: hypothetical protein FJ164_13330 [Gammaproteobacteria bacterium]|nr:hypothetical protein [Gammaproteobacteria bacterium]